MRVTGPNRFAAAEESWSAISCPTKIAGPTNFALALINFPSLAAYEQYRDALMRDPDAKANVEFADKSGCILVEDRSILRQVS